MAVDMKNLESWFQSRPRWLQDATRRLINNPTLSENDILELVDICIKEAEHKKPQYSGIIPSSLGLQDSTSALRLESITDVHGINALNPTKPLIFGKTSISIIWGRNGSGKSGYVRLLKHACGSRNPGELLSNIFQPKAKSRGCRFIISDGTKETIEQFTGESLTALQSVDIYDDASGIIYLNEENEVTVEPWLLRLFSMLTGLCEQIRKRLEQKSSALISKKPGIPMDIAGSHSAIWYSNLTGNTTKENIDGNISWTPTDEDNLLNIKTRLAEPNPSLKALALQKQKAFIEGLILDLQKMSEGLNDEVSESYINCKRVVENRKQAADEDSKKVFAQAPLIGIGSETWKLMWEAARKYSLEYPYKDLPFPNIQDKARCVLCQRELDNESRGRLTSFENFIKGELQAAARQAEVDFKVITDALPIIPSEQEVSTKMDSAGILNDQFRGEIIDFIGKLRIRKQQYSSVELLTEITSIQENQLIEKLIIITKRIEQQVIGFEEDAKGKNRPELELKQKELLGRKWLHQQSSAINEEILRLSKHKVIENAIGFTNTTALSKKKSDLTEELITKAYIDRFNAELKLLKAGIISVELVKTRSEVGHVYHRIIFKNASQNASTSDVLSEGERRIVSLAAFLADTATRGSTTPFIFDDPISSLDHVFEEAVAQRLATLGKTRQLIVFTHRLSLVALLEKYAGKLNIKPNLICLSRYHIGDIADLPINLKSTDKSVNSLLNERLAASKKAFKQGDEEYDKEATVLCHDIRVLVERIVEMDLLNEVIRRFNSEVQTKDKIHALAKIEYEDCTFIDNLMTKYSRYEHSQSEETPIILPEPDEIETDLKAIKQFIEKVQNRKKSK